MDAEALYEEAPCGLLSTSANGLILRANRTFCRWLGYESTELVERRRFAELLAMGSKIFHQTHWLPLLHMQGGVAELQLDLVHRDGRRLPFLVNAQRRADRDDIAVFAADDRRKYEDELLLARRRAEELLERERVAQQSLSEAQTQRAIFGEQLVGIVSHDLRTPLSVVSLGTEMLVRSEVAPEQQKHLLRRISSANGRALRLIADLLDFTQARLGGGLNLHAAEIDLDGVVADTMEDLKLAWHGRLLEMTGHGPAEMRADPDRIAQIVTNLVSNALTYGDAARAVSVTTSVVERHAMLAVHNWGPVIRPESLAQLFEPLRRGEQAAKHASRSVGLGLYIVSEIATAHGGHVTVSSTEERGTTFTVMLPLEPSSA